MRKIASIVSGAALLWACIGPYTETGGATEASAGSSSTGTTGATEPGTGSSTMTMPTTSASSTGGSTGGTPGGCADTAPPDEPIAWDRGQPDISGCATIRGLREVRAIMHLHSHHSHDACDGEPMP